MIVSKVFYSVHTVFWVNPSGSLKEMLSKFQNRALWRSCMLHCYDERPGQPRAFTVNGAWASQGASWLCTFLFALETAFA